MKTSKSHIAQMCVGIDHQITRAKDALEWYIKDKSVPLEVRWGVFMESPDYLKNHENWIYRFDCLTDRQNEERLDGDYYNRGQQINLACEIDGMVENIKFDKEWAAKEGLDYVNDNWYSEEILNKMKEEIMEKNLGSYRFDW